MNNVDEGKKTLLDMLRKLGGESAEFFKSYVPNHYAEVYSMYKLLQDVNVSHEDIEFEKPKKSGETSFIFVCKFLHESDVELIEKYLESDNEVQYLRNNRFAVTIKRQLTCTTIKFKHA